MKSKKGFLQKYGVTLTTMNAFLRSVALVNGRGAISTKIDGAFQAYGLSRPSETSVQDWSKINKGFIKQKGASFRLPKVEKAACRTETTVFTKAITRQPQPAPPNFSRSFVDPNGPDFLNSYAWKSLRMKVLVKYGRVCMCCGATPENSGEVMHVDHIKPRRNRPDLALDFENLQVLCGTCNHGKASWDETDWRPVTKSVPEREAEQIAFLKAL